MKQGGYCGVKIEKWAMRGRKEEEVGVHTMEGSWSGLAKPALRNSDPESSTAGSIAANPALPTPSPSRLRKRCGNPAIGECTSRMRSARQQSTGETRPAMRLLSERMLCASSARASVFPRQFERQIFHLGFFG